MTIIPEGYGQVVMPITHASVSRPAAVVYGIDMSSQPGSVVLCGKLLLDFTTQWASSLDSQCTVGPVVVYEGQADGTNVVHEGITTVVGTSAGERIPSNCALLLRKTSARGGRRGRGRMYLPWVVSETSCSDVGIVDSGTVTAYQAKATAFLTALGTASGPTNPTPMVLLHSPTVPAPGRPVTVPGDPNEVTALIVQNLIGSQRRRLAR